MASHTFGNIIRFWIAAITLIAHHAEAWYLNPSRFRQQQQRQRQLYDPSTFSGITTTQLYQSQPSYGLYEVQEEMLVNRGTIEEELMKDNYSLLQASNPKGTGSSGGFGGAGFGGGSKSGGSSKKKVSSKTLKTEAKIYAKQIKEQGVVRIDNVLDEKLADTLREFVVTLRQESTELVNAGSIQPIDRFAEVLLRKNRSDLKMPLGPSPVNNALNDVLCQSPVAATIQQVLGTDAVLYELSSLISDPGSDRQVIHPDNPIKGEEPVLITTFIALQDIDLDMGPTVWIPGTHTKEAHDQFMDEIVHENAKESPKDTLLRNTPAVLGTLKKGCCAMYDSRVLHAGTANRSALNKSRALFYFSFRNPNVAYPGNPASIRSNLLAANIKIGDLADALATQQKGKKSPFLSNLETDT